MFYVVKCYIGTKSVFLQNCLMVLLHLMSCLSADCSGESPNPGWMRGVKNHPPRTVDTGQGAHRRRGSFASSPNIHMSPAASPLGNQMYSERLQSSDSPRIQHNSGQQQSFPSRLSPDIVVIKNEPSPEQQSSCAFSRKRTADSSELQSDFYSSAKSRRVGGSSTLSSSVQESSSNQSLMSIINTESDSISLEPVDSSEADIFKVTMDAQDDQNQGLSGSPSNSTFSPRRLAASATSSSGSPNNQSWMGSMGDAGQGSSSQAGWCHFFSSNHILTSVKASILTSLYNICYTKEPVVAEEKFKSERG